MRRRTVLVAAAVLLALLGTTLVFSYAGKRGATATAEEELVAVLVATQPIPAGTTGQEALDQQLVALTERPASAVPQGALVDIASVADQEAASDLQPGEVLLPARFLDSNVAGTLDIPDDKVAVSLQLEDARRVAGFVRPGAEVVVFSTYQVNDDQATKVLLPRATVLAVGSTALKVFGAAEQSSEQQAASDPAGLVTLAVSLEDAQKLAHSGVVNQITLGLLNPDSRTGPLSADDNHTSFANGIAP